jgi:hypothetical protein
VPWGLFIALLPLPYLQRTLPFLPSIGQEKSDWGRTLQRASLGK